MIRVGITGQAGFIGTHLYHTLGLYTEEFERIPFDDAYFQNEVALRSFVSQCDVILHLAAVNRHPDPDQLYETNLLLVRKLIDAMESEKVNPTVFFSSSIQEEYNNSYGRSKKDGRELLLKWTSKNKSSFIGMVVPNVYGPFGLPNYNSFIATFCHKLTHGENPKILQDSDVRLIYVGNLCRCILDRIRFVQNDGMKIVEKDIIPYDFEKKVSEILALFEDYKALYLKMGFIPELKDKNEINLFNTFRCYIDHATHFPVKLQQFTDVRGTFVETIKLCVGGQVSFSTTYPGITRGNHYHIRKIERFIVIKGKARIQLRKIGTDEILNFYLDGSEHS